MQRSATSRRPEIARCGCDRRKRTGGNPGDFRKQRKKARIWLMRCKSADRRTRHRTQLFKRGDYFFQPRDCRARQRFPFKHHREPPVQFALDLHGFRVLIGASKKKIANSISQAAGFCFTSDCDRMLSCRIGILDTTPGIRRANKKRTRAIPEKPAKLSRDPSRHERAAVYIRRNHSDGPSLARHYLRLRHRKRVDHAEAGSANIEGAASFARSDARMKLRGQRRIKMMRFAGGDNRIDFICAAIGRAQRIADDLSAERHFVFAVRDVGKRFDSGAFAQLSYRHSESTIDFSGGNDARTKRESRPGNKRGRLRFRL